MKSMRRPFTINLETELIKKLKKIAKPSGISTSELVNRILLNFSNNFEVVNKTKKSTKTKATTKDDKKYLEYLDSVLKTLTDSSVPKKSKEFMIGK
ncbi:MAG TPA: hypothetical protein ENL20_00260 [Candidatus Cloacimonetes bacterium]|nr:hypothetical protein [Candidatus Cloacimonadota bacterium]